MCIDARAVASLALVWLASCSGERSPCLRLAAAGEHAAAAPVCVAELEESGDPAVGLAAARAHAALDRDEEALRLAATLRDGPLAGAALQLGGRILLDRERFDAARGELREALRIHQAEGDRAAAYQDAYLLSRLHWLRSELHEALELAEVARSEAAASGDPLLQANALISLGSVLQAAGDGARAVEIYQEAAAFLPADNEASRARLLVYRGVLLDEQGQHAQAGSFFEQARVLAAGAGETKLVLAAEVNLAEIALDGQRLDDAGRHLEAARAAWRASGAKTNPTGILLNEAFLARERGQTAAATAALDQAENGASREVRWLIAHERGRIAEAAGQLDVAERWYREAVGIVEEMRQSFTPEEVKAPFLEDRWQPYESLFELQLERDDAMGAFATLALAQGRMFLDTFVAAAADVQPPARSRIDGAIRRVDFLRDLVPPLAQSPIGPALGPADALSALREQYVLTYFAARGRMRLLVVAGGEVRETSLDIGLDELDRRIDEFLADPEDDGAAAALGQALLPPDALPAPPARVHVVPIGPLLRVPFAALRVRGSRVIDSYEIAYAPSVTGLAALAAVPRLGAGPAVILADARRDLPHAEAELRVVVAETGATPSTGQAATIAALRAAAEAPLLHVVSHSGVDHAGGYLALADGPVTAADIVAWGIRPRLVVLPTCASAATMRSEMWGSLAAAFLAAGSTDVVATLRSVEDAVAAEFTRLYYRHGGARDPVGATRRAQQEMAGRYPVAAWSAFIVAGL